MYRRYGRVPASRIVCLGHPKLDAYFDTPRGDTELDRIAAASVGRFKIIYSPHHSLDGLSTFMQ